MVNIPNKANRFPALILLIGGALGIGLLSRLAMNHDDRGAYALRTLTDFRERTMNEIYFRPSSFTDSNAQRFAAAVAAGNVHDALYLAKALPDGVDTAAPDGVTALLIAVNHLDLRMIEALLKEGANPNGAPGRAPLALAVRAPDLKMAKILLAAGADPNGRMDSKTALMQASRTGNEAATSLLLQFHSNVNLGDSLGSTAVMEAAAAQHWRLVLFLLGHGASPWASTEPGVTLGNYAWLSRINPASAEGKAWLQVIQWLKGKGYPWPPPTPKEVLKLRAEGQWPPPGTKRR